MSKEAKYIIYNSEIVQVSKVEISTFNRAFRYGDAIFETMHANDAKVQFFEHHFSRLTESMQTLKMELPEGFNVGFLAKIIHKLLDRNKFYKGARVRLTVYRSGKGYYVPNTNQVSFIVECEALQNAVYKLNEKGKQINIYNEIRKPVNKLSLLKSGNALLFVMAGIYLKENNLDDCIILNEKTEICEFISSNIFIIKNSTIYTPPITAGCVNGIMRKIVIEIAAKLNYKLVEKKLVVDNLNEAEEVFSTNAIQGIQWIGAFGHKRYFNRLSLKLSQELNQYAF
ncbi:MAG: 4-amino-4-deoxychorismate lyase [Chlorobi bacterium]|nr:4-amino-4-deoxychorismate lyase [Chlorobiota bacterium]